MDIDRLGGQPPSAPLMLMQRIPAGAKSYAIDRLAHKMWIGLAATATAATALSACHIALVGLTLLNGAALFVSAVALLSLLSVQYADSLIPHLPEKWQHLAHHLQAVINESFTLIPIVCLYFFNAVSEKPSNHPPILCVHGYLHRSSAWFYLKACLEEEGLGQMYSLNLPTPFNSIEMYSIMVENKIKEIKQKTGAKEVTLVLHSMGGVVGSHLATTCGEDLGVKKIVTLASPLLGTRLAVFGVGECAKQMRHGPENAFINGIHERIGTTEHVRFLHIGTEHDAVIIPHESTIPYHGQGKKHIETRVVKGLGHLSVLYSPRITQWVVEFIMRKDKGVGAGDAVV